MHYFRTLPRVAKIFTIIVALLLFPIAIGIILTYYAYKWIPYKKVKWAIVTALAFTTFIFGTVWVIALVSPSSPKTNVESLDSPTPASIEPTPQPTTMPTDTPSPSPEFLSAITLPDEYEEATVVQVVDGDTIQLNTNKKVRYIGIDTPETKDPNSPVECYGKEASEVNARLVLGKTVKLEKDVSETDRYGRQLRYVWIDDIFVNEYLVREGYAHASTYPPDVKYQDIFTSAEQEAREGQKGLWGLTCDNWTAPTPTTYTPKPTLTPRNTPVDTGNASNNASSGNQQPAIQPQSSGGYTCNCSKTCTKISSCDEAYFQLKQCGCAERDGDDDGVPCESLCM